MLSLLVCQQILAVEWTYNPTSSTCTGIGSDVCGPAYWGNIAGYEDCENVDNVSKQSPIDFTNVAYDESLQTPKFEWVEGGCSVS